MADILSQTEIDALLSAFSTGELKSDELDKFEEKQKVRAYDFRSPQKFSKDHIRTLELIHDKFSRIISNYLTAQLRNNIKVRVKTVEQITYEEFIHSIQNPTIMTVFKMKPLTGTILFETNPQFSYKVIDILLGGAGGRQNVNKEFSDIDKNIMKQITSGIISNLKLAWEDVLNVEPEVESLETNPAINQTLAPNEPVALITFSVEMGKNTTFINLCIPYLSIEKVLDKLVMQYWFNQESDSLIEEERKRIEKVLDPVEVDLSALLGTTNISIDDFLKLSIGDVIKLDNRCTSPIQICVEDKECYYAKPGIVGKNMGVSILDTIDKDVN